MKTIVVMGALALALSSGVGVLQAQPPSFVIVAINDPHFSGSSTNQTQMLNVRNWVLANQTSKNIVGVIINGDNQNDPFDADALWTTLAGYYTDFHNAGIPTMIVPGNHDQAWSIAGGSGVTKWNSFLAPLVASWSTQSSNSVWSAGSTKPIVNSVDAYMPFDVTLSGTTYKLAFVSLNMQATAGDVAAARVWMDAATDRQFIIGTHMFITDLTLGPGAVHPCIYGEISACTSAANADPGTQDGAGIWNGLKGNPRIAAITSGHWHLSANTTLTGTSGNLVPAVQGLSTAVGGTGNVLLMKFVPSTNTLTVSAWKTSTDSVNTAETNMGTAGVATYAWTPLPTTVPVIATTTLPGVTIGSAYTTTLSASQTPTSWTVSGQIPMGMSMNLTTGVLSGTPHMSGSFPLTFNAINSVGTSSNQSITLAVAAVAPPYGDTIFYRDRDRDGYGVGKKSSGVYELGVHDAPFGPGSPYFAAPAAHQETGDMLDADDEDPSVHTTAEWEAAWGSDLAAFLLYKYGFNNASRTFWVADTGSNTGSHDKTHPYLNMAPIQTAIHDQQGGLVVIRQRAGGATYDKADLCFTIFCMTGIDEGFSGSAGHPLYLMAYPGEHVQMNGKLIDFDASRFPFTQLGYVTYDGFLMRDDYYNYFNAVNVKDSQFLTIRNCEFAGWHDMLFSEHTQDLLIERNVAHEVSTHWVYLNQSSMITVYDADGVDFDFVAAEARYVTTPANGGPSQRVTVQDNSVYNCGEGGYDAIHFNMFLKDVTFRRNFVSYSGGSGMAMMTGVFDALVENNQFLDNSAEAIVIDTHGARDGSGGPGNYGANEGRIMIRNNTIWQGQQGVMIRNKPIGPPILIVDNTPDNNRLHDISIVNNIIVTDNYPDWGDMPIVCWRGCDISTLVVKNNVFNSHNTLSNAVTNTIVWQSTLQVPSQAQGTRYLMATMNTGTMGPNNVWSNPLFTASNRTWTHTPELFDMRPLTGSPAIGVGATSGAPTTDIFGVARTGGIDLGSIQNLFSTSPGKVSSKGFVNYRGHVIQ